MRLVARTSLNVRDLSWDQTQNPLYENLTLRPPSHQPGVKMSVVEQTLSSMHYKG